MRIHDRVVVYATFWVPRETILFKKVSASRASWGRWPRIIVIGAPFLLKDEFPMFRMFFNPFFLLLVGLLKICFEFLESSLFGG